ncbi:MAG: FAD-dependent oxidoreductase [Lachnospiraceae bacterium]|nr:FAD-dependent oxidoreductase [Lachnospiraceae bacterium]
MIRISDIRVPAGSDEEHVRNKTAHLLRVSPEMLSEFKILKRSKDARHKENILDVYTVSVSLENEARVVKRCGRGNVCIIKDEGYRFPSHGDRIPLQRPVIAGFGPAGIFAGLLLSHEGYRPLILERGRRMEERIADVERFIDSGILDPDSNVQFGEGGAGTFSDGKLSSGIKDREGRKDFILQTFVRHGADPDILISAHPHIGTDRLMKIIPSIRKEIESLGGEVRFDTAVEGVEISDGRIKAVKLSAPGSSQLECEDLFLCIGHSARDTFEMLCGKGLAMEAKPFAVGVRAEHDRQMIDGALHVEKADYKLTYHCDDGRGVYSFCMCPGGYVINASSEKGGLTVNGMSYSQRDGRNSNAAIVCTVSPEDYESYGDDPLSGIRFQRDLERKAFKACDADPGAVPYQRYEDFRLDRMTAAPGSVVPACRGRYGMGNLRRILPAYICDDIIEAMSAFGRKIRGYDGDDTLFAGIEARTSSPVRLIRGDDMQSANIKGIYPVGEGAGYAGGIMSAAIDGMKAAEKYIGIYRRAE